MTVRLPAASMVCTGATMAGMISLLTTVEGIYIFDAESRLPKLFHRPFCKLTEEAALVPEGTLPEFMLELPDEGNVDEAVDAVLAPEPPPQAVRIVTGNINIQCRLEQREEFFMHKPYM